MSDNLNRASEPVTPGEMRLVAAQLGTGTIHQRDYLAFLLNWAADHIETLESEIRELCSREEDT